MNISFLDNWRRKHGAAPGASALSSDDPAARETDQSGIAELLSECQLLRSQAAVSGVELDDSESSLQALDQLVPRWRDDPEVLPWLGNDAGLYLGTVIVRTVPGAHWVIASDDQPVVELDSGREIDVVEMGHTWAETGTPELAHLYAEVSED
ncbi:DUF6278 family protein [Streptomyces sp. NPDC051940]|uniref:DUF6278 family protein n=1 Tax=Streptomyces sp. NPDC051940 TaxID=3155675 RepID=UPI0034392CB4